MALWRASNARRQHERGIGVIAFGTLGRYFGLRFLAGVGAVFFVCVGMIALVDFFELARRFGNRPNASVLDLTYLVLLRLPSFTEQILPFAVLLGAMAAFLTLSRRLEFVVARAAGMSVWQFTGSAAAIALTLGVFAVTIYNPLSASMKEWANQVEASLLDKRATLFQGSGDGVWVRQQSIDGQAIVQASATIDQGRVLTGVTFFTFNDAGAFLERIEAKSARLEDGYWLLNEARITSSRSKPAEHVTYRVSTNLTEDQVRGRLRSPDSLSFWNLPEVIEMSERAGIRSERYRLQYHALLARPLFLIAMVLIAAAVSLRMFRMGGAANMVLGGVSAGFLLYVAARLAEELGESGIVHPALAAWFPAVFGVSMGYLVLLHQEDG
jgi:lipopolysaccharide export system permease protein